MNSIGEAPRPRAQWRGEALGAVLFDLDGTLLDTAGDIALALNRALGERGLMPIPVGDVRTMIGRGAPNLVRRACAFLGLASDEALHAPLLERFYHHSEMIEERAETAATPYDGALRALAGLHAAGLRIAVVTNKQHRFAAALVRGLGLGAWVDLVVGGDTCAQRKPDPEPLLFACARLGTAPAAALMVGDSINDVQAARAAGIPVICVPYGYNEGRDPRSLPCDAVIESLGELPSLLLGGD